MRSRLLWLLAGSLVIYAAFADDELRFEVASVRPSKGSGFRRMSGGPGTQDPGQFVCENCKLTNLLVVAYGVPMYQVDAPPVLDSRRADVVAKVAPSHSRADFRIMLQNLLAERFDCRIHWETRALPVYSLEEVRGGHKFKESATAATGTNTAAAGNLNAAPKLGEDGYPDLKGTRFKSAMIGNRLRLELPNAIVADLVNKISLQLPVPVIDRTGLDGRYDFVLSWISDEGSADHVESGGLLADGLDETGPDLFFALQKQLGLRLEKSKADMRVLVVDHMRELPSDN